MPIWLMNALAHISYRCACSERLVMPQPVQVKPFAHALLQHISLPLDTHDDAAVVPTGARTNSLLYFTYYSNSYNYSLGRPKDPNQALFKI